MIKNILFVFILSFASFAKEKVVYKYKQYEKFDLGDLEVKGQIIAPGDLTVKQRRRKVFTQDLYDRNHFNKEVILDIKYLR